MKKVVTILIMIMQGFVMLYAGDNEQEDKKGYAGKGVWELSGSGSFSTQFYQDNRKHEINLTPAVAYFIVKRAHIGLKHMLLYTISSSDISPKWHYFYDYAVMFSLGYVCTVHNEFYVDVMTDYGITFSKNENPRYYSLISALKYDLKRVLLVMNLTYRYIDYGQESLVNDYTTIQIGIGISLYL
jgi:hypothetical protein